MARRDTNGVVMFVEYIWMLDGWPEFQFKSESLLTPVSQARFTQGEFLALMRSVGIDARLESELEATVDDVLKTSAIEGEMLNPASVRSSIARRLGIPDHGVTPKDTKVEGVVDIVMDAVKNHATPLTAERIYGWHAALFPTGYSGLHKIDVGQWRTDAEGPMQVVSNHSNPRKRRVHYEAPPAERLDDEMTRFLRWFNGQSTRLDPILRAGIAHLWYVSIHPLDDGNGRTARAIADLAVAQAEKTGQRFYSMSSQIERDKDDYYATLEATQKGDLDITDWLEWFVGCYARAIKTAHATAERVVNRARFWQTHAARPFNDRQTKALTRLLDDFKDPMTSQKWSSMCHCSKETAIRDIADLAERGILLRNEGSGKRTSYRLNWPPEEEADLTAEPEGEDQDAAPAP